MKGKAAEKGIRISLLCLFPIAHTPFSARLFDAIVSGCILVVVSDELELPFERLLQEDCCDFFSRRCYPGLVACESSEEP
ncbi:unnamed protein product [Arabis nemorensis]|uniref:Exostosin GT47 domain-containing protein n=1 Tax=Arabis nemorensis TaxID=586526 RepID=A0A565ASI6_9BRAS|nr:unnamed protein product [Arabis nemorensis]